MRKQDWLVQRSGLRWLKRIDAIKADPPFLFLTQEDKMRRCTQVVPHGGGGGSLGLIFAECVVTFGQICHFRDSNSVTFCCFELTHFLDWMKNTLLFICSTNILVRLPTVNMKNCLTPKNSKMCYPILVTLLKMRPHYSPVVKMRPHPAAHPH